MPPPTGVVNGPLMATRKLRIASTVSFGSHSLNALNAFSPANTSNHATCRFPPYACSTAASKTRREAFQMSRPVPSPSMKGMMGVSGTRSSPPLYSIPLPPAGVACPLYEFFIVHDLLPTMLSGCGCCSTEPARVQRESKKIPQSQQIPRAADSAGGILARGKNTGERGDRYDDGLDRIPQGDRCQIR